MVNQATWLVLKLADSFDKIIWTLTIWIPDSFEPFEYPSTGPQNSWKVIEANGPSKLETFAWHGWPCQVGHCLFCERTHLFILLIIQHLINSLSLFLQASFWSFLLYYKYHYLCPFVLFVLYFVYT